MKNAMNEAPQLATAPAEPAGGRGPFMPHLPSFVAELFSGDAASGRTVPLQWWLIQRKGAPFLLLPRPAAAGRAGLSIYSPQRRVAKMESALLRLILSTPASSLLPPASMRADADSDLLRFIADQPGADPSIPPAIIMGNLSLRKQRFVMLVLDQDFRPVSVIKAGVKPEAQALIDREADLLTLLPLHVVGASKPVDRLSTPRIKAFSMAYCQGENPATDELIGVILRSWINPGPPEPIGTLDVWQEFTTHCSGVRHFEALKQCLAAERVHTVVQHGDFTPWNIRVDRSGSWKIFDWERGHLRGVPGWDWFHFVTQRSILVRRETSTQTICALENLLGSERFCDYAAAAGIQPITRPLALAYLAYQNLVVKPDEGHLSANELYEALVDRWGQAAFTPGPAESRIPVRGETARIVPMPGAAATATAPAAARTAAPERPEGDAWFAGFWSIISWILTHRNDGVALRPAGRKWYLQQWFSIGLSAVLMLAIGSLHRFGNARMSFLPLYLIPCTILTLMVNRRWGTACALASSFMGPWFLKQADSDFNSDAILLWNTLMRFIIFETVVILLDRIRIEIQHNHARTGRI